MHRLLTCACICVCFGICFLAVTIKTLMKPRIKPEITAKYTQTSRNLCAETYPNSSGVAENLGGWVT